MSTPDVSAHELRFVQMGDVYKNGRLAARLAREAGGIRFEYFADYLDDARAPAIATTLPRTDVPVVAAAGAVPPFFAGLLPEGRRLGALQRAVKTSADDDLTLLLAIGADTVGDVQVVPDGSELGHDNAALVVEDWSTLSFADLYRDLTGERLVPARANLAGVQVKASARMVSLSVRRPDEYVILKLDPPEYRHLIADEKFFLDAARQSGLAVAKAEIVYDAHGGAGLVVRRFDRVGTDGTPRMLAVEDACQVLGHYPADKYNLDTADVIRGLARVSGAPIVAARDLLRQFAFAYLTGNGDAHAKNFSVVQSPSGEWGVSPAYDIPSSAPYADHTMALPIGGKTDERIGRGDFVALGETVGVRARATERVLDELLDRADLWLPQLETLPFDHRTVHELRRAVEYRRQRLSRN